jgi:hypothetical protein
MAEIKNKIDELAFFIASESDNVPLLAKKKALTDQVEALNKAQKRSEYTASKSQQYHEKGTKEFFSSFKGGFANSDVSSLYVTPDWNNPASRDGSFTQEEDGIAEEFRRYCDTSSNPKRRYYPSRSYRR